jgi:hypothetical protein
MPEKFQFDRSAEFHLSLRLPDGKLTEIALRYPTDEEAETRRRAVKHVTTNLGRGTLEGRAVPALDVDKRIYEAAKLNGSPDIDEDTASLLLDRLSQCQVRDVKFEGAKAVVSLKVLGGLVTHRLQIPSPKQVRLMQDAATHTRTLPHSRFEQRHSLLPPAKLWEECQGESEDYANGIPLGHKDVAIRAVVEQLDNEMTSPAEETDDF